MTKTAKEAIAVALAIYDGADFSTLSGGTGLPLDDWRGWCPQADAAILALRQWMDAEGLVCVPRAETYEMREAGLSAFHDEAQQRGINIADAGLAYTMLMRTIYTAMIAAAPDALKATDPAQDGGE